jgi:predicted MFS family arabinose efflux permease
VGVALGGVLGQTIGPRGALFVAVLAILLAPLWLARSPLRHMQTLPELGIQVVSADAHAGGRSMS